ncbi:ATP synthase F0 subunit B [uncultured Oscillibacter sp.]|uniref:ATP synthase F0 subunit B n=1 Tax=uncultured Oscillibacter sp. TaxID=876091 RepID=UPI0025EB821F|nr:ATP synthase F0 subunit B [uncultured Oscillibacter sp.]
MNIPLNVDWQQILLHWMNLVILTGGLYLLLYKPVKQFMEKREAHYRELDEQAARKLEEAEALKASYQAKLDGAEEEIRQARAKAQAAVQQSVEEQKAQAEQIIAKAQAEAASSRERMMRESQRELRELTVRAVKKLTVKADMDLFDQFLDLAEGGEQHEDQ